MRLVPASMSCTVCLCRRSQLVTRPGLSPVLPAPAVSAHLWCQHLPLQRQPQICGLTRQGQLCLVWCWACQLTCLWWVLYMCVEGIVHVCGCMHVHMCMYCYCTHTYSINLCHVLHTVLYSPLWLLVKLPRFVKSRDCHMDQWSHFPPSCGLY